MIDQIEHTVFQFASICSALSLVTLCEFFCLLRWPFHTSIHLRSQMGLDLGLKPSAKIKLLGVAVLLEIIKSPRKDSKMATFIFRHVLSWGSTFSFNQSRKWYTSTSGLNWDYYFIGNLPIHHCQKCGNYFTNGWEMRSFLILYLFFFIFWMKIIFFKGRLTWATQVHELCNFNNLLTEAHLLIANNSRCSFILRRVFSEWVSWGTLTLFKSEHSAENEGELLVAR